MKALIIGGTGTISTAVVADAAAAGWELWVLNRGRRDAELPEGVHPVTADIADEDGVREALEGLMFDTVADFIGFTGAHAERAVRLFTDRTAQYIYISSASVYQKPLGDYLVRESTPLSNPLWAYSQGKIDSENRLMDAYRRDGFPVTIVRPSHTYGKRAIPMGFNGTHGSWQVIERMMQGKPVVVHGDGSSLWTMTWNEDFARGFTGLMGNARAIGEAVHITSDESLTWNRIYEIVAGALGVQPYLYHIASDFIAAFDPAATGSLTGDKAVSVVFDNSKIKRLVPGFTCPVRFDQGVRRCLDHILSHPECRTPDPAFDRLCDRMIAALERAKEEA
ncbi:MAG: NAD-dependent epimerase/dehydratase family protein [Clostridia bacterium]|nr:NAD-dependent epimerase/dehydratase family protein [Clostridia bacterium]